MSSNIRYDWYQSEGSVTVDIFAKNIIEDTLKVQFETDKLYVTFTLSSGTKYEQNFRPSQVIVPVQCFYTLSGIKLEIHLHKAEPKTWKSLEIDEKIPPSEQPANYPSSAKQQHDWAKLEAEIKTQKLDSSGTVEEFFQKLYADATDDTKRAMIKSFVESKGTVLSTNWDKVGNEEVKPIPPE